MKRKILQILLILFMLSFHTMAQRKFIHPGITYSQGDLDRMKAMIKAHREPFYSTYLQLAASSFAQSTVTGNTNVTRISESQHNNTIGMDGRKAHDNALMWHLTDNKAYADNAVKLLNGYLNLTNSSSRGTSPLDNGKIYMLIEAAELMRDYPGWNINDQKKFKDMLVHPGYSARIVPTSHFSSVDSLNDVTFYWNIFNFDRGRFGNQGLFAARGMMAMGIYLDNDTIYDRVHRYLLGLPHRPDDLPYQSGPAIIGSVISESVYKFDYNALYSNQIPDYGYDELLKYYIYQNGECQESCRDQGHTMGGVGSYTCIAEMAWNQGDSLYNCLDNRILKGIEFNTRYNLSLLSYPDQTVPWEVKGFSTNEADCTYDNGYFYQAMNRSGRWSGKAMSPDGRNADFGPGGWREQALAHYKVRMGVSTEEMKWLQRSDDKLIADYGFENWGISGHHYEWFGWGTLTKRRTEWMAGEPVTFVNGMRISGAPSVPCNIKAVDYDYFCGNGEGHTFHNIGKNNSSLYRTDGTIEIAKDGIDYVVTDMNSGEWMNYSVVFPAPLGNMTSPVIKQYNIYATYKSTGPGAKLFVAVDNGVKTGKDLIATDQWTERCLGTLSVSCGAGVLRVFVKGINNLMQLKNIRIEPIEVMTLTTANINSLATSVKVYNSSNIDVTSSYQNAIIAAADGNYNTPILLAAQKFLVYDFGEQGLDLSNVIFYNDGVIRDTREMATVLGSTENTSYKLAWNSALKLDIFRTNGTITNNFVINDNSWTSVGNGYYNVGPVGKYRYLGIYNWSAPCNISELEIKYISNISSLSVDTETPALWDDSVSTYVEIVKLNEATRPIVEIIGHDVIVKEAKKIEAYTITGIKIASVNGERITLDQGLFILKIRAKINNICRKIVIE